jgi:hypothetical protein
MLKLKRKPVTIAIISASQDLKLQQLHSSPDGFEVDVTKLVQRKNILPYIHAVFHRAHIRSAYVPDQVFSRRDIVRRSMVVFYKQTSWQYMITDKAYQAGHSKESCP